MSFLSSIGDFFMGTATSSSGLSSLAQTANNISAIAAPLITGYSMYSQNKAIDEAEAASTAQFTDNLRAALTNSEWVVADNKYNYLISQEYNDSIKKSTINGVMESYDTQAQYMENITDLKAMLNIDMAGVDLAKLKEESLSQLKLTAAKAKADMEYVIATAKSAADYNTSQAIIDSVAYYQQAQAAVTFLDRDVATIREDLQRTAEALDIETASTVGKVLNSVANTLTAGNSVSRRIMATTINSDRIKQQKVSEAESGIAKAYATQEKTATEANSNIQETINTAIARNIKLKKDANAQLANITSNTKATTDSIVESASILGQSLINTTAINNEYLYTTNKEELDYLLDKTAIEVGQITDRYDAQNIADKETLDYNNYIEMRGREETYRTMIESGITRDEGVAGYIDFLESEEGKFYVNKQKELGLPASNLLSEEDIESYYVGARALNQPVSKVISDQITGERKQELNEKADEFVDTFNTEIQTSTGTDITLGSVTSGFTDLAKGVNTVGAITTTAGMLTTNTTLAKVGSNILKAGSVAGYVAAGLSLAYDYDQYTDAMADLNPESTPIERAGSWAQNAVAGFLDDTVGTAARTIFGADVDIRDSLGTPMIDTKGTGVGKDYNKDSRWGSYEIGGYGSDEELGGGAQLGTDDRDADEVGANFGGFGEDQQDADGNSNMDW